MIERQLEAALLVLERHQSLASSVKDTASEMIYAKCINKIREALFELQQNLCVEEDVLFS